MGRLIAKIVNVEKNKKLNLVKRIDGGSSVPQVICDFLNKKPSGRYVFFISPNEQEIIRYEIY